MTLTFKVKDQGHNANNPNQFVSRTIGYRELKVEVLDSFALQHAGKHLYLITLQVYF